jgi:gluconokinase
MGTTRTILIITGVSGSGKTTIGTTLAEQLGWPFKEGDELHSPSNITKMHSGHPLDDRDRWPWLEKIADWIDSWRQAGTAGVITCSALKRSYRDFLTSGRPEVRVVYLHGEKAVIAARLAERKEHLMPRSLLDSQLAVLEEPDPDEELIRVEIDRLVGDIVAEIVRELNSPIAENRSTVVPQLKPDLKQASTTVGPRPSSRAARCNRTSEPSDEKFEIPWPHRVGQIILGDGFNVFGANNGNGVGQPIMPAVRQLIVMRKMIGFDCGDGCGGMIGEQIHHPGV